MLMFMPLTSSGLEGHCSGMMHLFCWGLPADCKAPRQAYNPPRNHSIHPVPPGALQTKVTPTLRWLNRLRDRLIQVGYVDGDPLAAEVQRAAHAMQALRMAIHYADVPHGVGQPQGGEQVSPVSGAPQ